MTIQSQQRSVQLRSSVSEQSPRSSASADLIQIEGGSEHNTILILYPSFHPFSQLTGIRHNSTSGVSDERGSVEVDETLITELLTNTVASNDGNVVGLFIIIIIIIIIIIKILQQSVPA